MKRAAAMVLVLLMVLFLDPAVPVRAAIAAGDGIPPALEPWQEWVLHDQTERTCPSQFDDPAAHRCWWPARLDLDVGDQGGLFDLHVKVYAAAWVTLPGDDTHWPESVSTGSDPVPVVVRDGRPSIRLEAGDYLIRGAFVWDRLPDTLRVPAPVGILFLKIDGREVADPQLDGTERLRVRSTGDAPRKEDTLAAALFRLIEDDVPMRVVTRVRLDVAGRAREVRLPVRLPDGATVMQIDSPLPARLAENGELLVQVRPGRWEIGVTERLAGPVTRLSAGAAPYGDETWSFKAYPHLRMVKVAGAPPVEPSRTRMPDEWKAFPAYLVKPGAILAFEVIRRGDPDPPPDQLSLERTWWLDFDGSGFTVHDRIGGTLRRTWHLALPSPMELGRVAVDGRDQLITRQDDTTAAPGVQLRRGRLDLEADSRLPRTSSRLPAVGWDHDFQQVRGVLHLPPGWTLFSLSGVDGPTGAWLQRWSLLDCFLVLIIAISTYKLRDPRTAGLILATLLLVFHEPGAPQLVWLHLLAVTALLKVLPDGWFKRLVRLWGAAAALALIVIALPFAVQQVRMAVYPQLAGPAAVVDDRTADPVAERSRAERPALLSKAAPMADDRRQTAEAQPDTPAPTDSRDARLLADPDALIQTGPGLPTWRWRSVPLRWNGPVDRSQQIRLGLISPAGNLLLGTLRVVLLLWTIGLFLDLRNWRRRLPAPLAAGIASLVLGMVLLAPPPALQAAPADTGFPPQALLDELRRRLLEPPPCFPHCADVSRLELAATPDQLRLILLVHAQVETAIPLPATQETWRPTQLTLDNEPVVSLARDDKGDLWMVIPRGVHRIKMTGPIGSVDEIRIAFPIVPHVGTYAGVGWQARGFRPDTSMEGSITLTRTQREKDSPADLPKADVPAYFHVSRTLHLGLQWEATTHVRRLTEPGKPAILTIPLLPTASLTTPGIQVVDGGAQISLGPDQTEAHFSTTLPISPSIELSAPPDAPWTESWTLDAAAIWRCTVTGLTPVHHQDADQNWQPQWRPWPGERVSIAVTRPKAVPGRTTTIDGARLDLTPGRRFAQALLTLGIHASKGGHHQVELPEMANLQTVTVDGQPLPVRQDGRLVSIPLAPGRQTVAIQWLMLNPSLNLIRAPRVQVGDEAVNAAVTVHMPDQRWILLTGGPRLGPAVLFWSWVIVVLAVAVGLGQTTLTPLRTGQWALLGLGLTQLPAAAAAAVVGWLLALGYRCRSEAASRPMWFNLAQVLLALLTLAALAALYQAVEGGLLGIPDMQIAGNQSTRLQLNWAQDRIVATMPTPWVLSLPQWVYHLLMLGWSLWLAFSLVGWLRWGWGCFAKTALWKPMPMRWRWRRKPSGTGDGRSGIATEPLPGRDGSRGPDDAPGDGRL